MSVYPQIPIDGAFARRDNLTMWARYISRHLSNTPKETMARNKFIWRYRRGNPYKTANRNPLTTLKHNTFNFKSQTTKTKLSETQTTRS